MRDELLERVVDELRTLPPVDDAAIGKIVRAVTEDENAVLATRSTGRGGWLAVRGAQWLQSSVPLAAAAGLALAAGLGGYAIRGESSSTAVAATSVRPESALLVSANRATATLAATSFGAEDAVATQFVLEAPRASRVALVGDFNAWNAAQTPLVRDASSGMWTVTVRLAPGRHVYAFMVDGTQWTLDPRAPSAQDPDFGTPSSVVLVGTP
jgi:hypothetical protein